MAHSTQKSHLGAFGLSVQLEGSVQQLESLAARLQQVFLSDSAAVDAEDATALIGELRRLVRRTDDQLTKLEDSFGCRDESGNGNGRRPPDAPPPKPRVKVPTNGLRGSTRAIPLPDLLSLLSGQKKTGTLHLKSKQECFVLEFLDGAIVHAVTNAPRPDQRLGTILVAQNRISPEKLDEFLEQHDPGNGPLGAALARANLVSEDDLLGALSRQVQDLFRRIFELDVCLFYFSDGEVQDLEHRACLNTTHLLLETARNQDERAME